MAKKRVVVGLSGGVDSSVSAYLLKQQGYDVIGLFMKNWDEQEGGCTAQADFNDVRRVCEKIEIPYYSVDFCKEYKEYVFNTFLQKLKEGKTPNPDVLCNRYIKFGPFLNHALKLGADYVATGHYANVYEKEGFFYLKKALDKNKDQTYFLNQLTQAQLNKVIFPVGNMLKTDVRKLAQAKGLSTALKKDSTGICFIGERNFKNFLKGFLPAQKGEIKTLEGKTVGTHEGVIYYTLGQRRGLGIGGVKNTEGGRWFVVSKDIKNNVLYVHQGNENVLNSKTCTAINFNWIPNQTVIARKAQPTKQSPCHCEAQSNEAISNCHCEEALATKQSPNAQQTQHTLFAKFRYRQPDQKVIIETKDGTIVKIIFQKPQRAVTEGQFAVLYDQYENCLGGGEIETVIK